MWIPLFLGAAVVAGRVAYVGTKRARRAEHTLLNVVKLQLDGLLQGSTLVAYQLASPSNRRSTAAPQHDVARFDHMVRTQFAPMLAADDYAVVEQGSNTVGVLLYAKERRIAGYEFRLGKVLERDMHESLGEHRLDGRRQVWRTNAVVPLDRAAQSRVEEAVRARRQERLRQRCFGAQWRMSKVGHSFGEDATHNLCCRLGPQARAYADSSGNRIGEASRDVRPEGPFTHWSTCMGSNVCGAYQDMFDDGTGALFATNRELTALAVALPPGQDCEAMTAQRLHTASHGTPGIRTRGDPSKCTREPTILRQQRAIDDWLAKDA